MTKHKVALYRKYRPENFDQITGQDHICKVLKNALKKEKVSHAYLFSGPRGTGKTSVARILAKAINCEGLNDYNPCDKCKSCLAIDENATMDLIEIDAASNRGIDEIRDLREKIKFAPTDSAYKIFIIDEVHMLTKEAFNALLKTLEEPPSHAFFILATTEINKVPTTIMSRCQRHDFRRIKLNDISARLSEVAKKETIRISDEALDMISQASEGGLRDALSVMDQLSSAGVNNIEAVDVMEVVGLAPYQKVYDFVKGLAEGESRSPLLIVEDLEKNGSDLIVFARSVQELLSKIIMAKLGGIDQIEGTKEQLEDIQILSADYEIDVFIKISENIIEAQKNFKSGIEPGFALSIMCATESVGPKQEKIVREEIMVKKTEKETTQEIVKEQPAVSADKPDKRTNGQWQHFLMEVKSKNNTIHAFLRVASPQFAEDTLTLVFPYKFHKEKMEEVKTKKMVEEQIAKIYGQDYRILCILEGNGGNGRALTETDSAASILGGELVEE